MVDRRYLDQIDRVQLPHSIFQSENVGSDHPISKDILRDVQQRILDMKGMMTVIITQDIYVNSMHHSDVTNTYPDDICYGKIYPVNIWRRNIKQYNLASCAQDGRPQFLKIEFLASQECLNMNAIVEFFPYTSSREYYKLSENDEGVMASDDGSDVHILSCQHVHVNVFMKLSECYTKLASFREEYSKRERMVGLTH